RGQERNVGVLIKFLLVLITLITLFSVAFHFVMLSENREFSWITGFYWTLTVMSTLGFGDITFTSDLGMLFSIVVLLSGLIFLLTMLPFIFIRFLYLPWLESHTKARVPRELSQKTENHIILSNYDPIAINLVERLKQHDYGYVILLQDTQQALELHDLDYNVVLGDLGDPETYKRVRAQKAALLFANVDDIVNTNIAFTVREISRDIPVVANADLDESVDILELAGSTYVFQFMKMLGQSLARRVLGASTRANVIGAIDTLVIAEAPMMRTPLVGQTLQQANLRGLVGITVVGLWERGKFQIPTAQTLIGSSTVLLLAGSTTQLENYDKQFGHFQNHRAPILILGGGRVGIAAAQALEERKIEYRIIEKEPSLVKGDHYVLGSAADIHTLRKAGIQDAPSVIITTRNDATNIYLTIYCRKLRPDIQIISRANFTANIWKLHEAGADLVMSYSSMAANVIMSLLKPGEQVMLAEGLNVFTVETHPSLIGKTLAESHIRRETGCNLIAVHDKDEMIINPDPSYRFREGNELIIVGTTDAERNFFKLFPGLTKRKRS
ncbi:MAG: TrkA family potassium uptake protein, partial [Desulfomonilaceae bacterium]